MERATINVPEGSTPPSRAGGPPASSRLIVPFAFNVAVPATAWLPLVIAVIVMSLANRVPDHAAVAEPVVWNDKFP